MGWMKTLLGARWFPYVVIGSITAAGVVYGWGYLKGYGTAEQQYQQEMNRALQAQYDRLIQQAEVERKLALEQLEKKYAIQQKVSDVRPSRDSCDLPPDCLRWYDDILRAASSGPLGID